MCTLQHSSLPPNPPCHSLLSSFLIPSGFVLPPPVLPFSPPPSLFLSSSPLLLLSSSSSFRPLVPQALQSMFQLVMQEGWTDLMSELACHRPYWLPIMLYVILLHLFASQVRLTSMHSERSQLLSNTEILNLISHSSI